MIEATIIHTAFHLLNTYSSVVLSISRSKKKYSETDGLIINEIQEHDGSDSEEFDEFDDDDDDDDDYDDEFFSEDTEDDNKVSVESITSPPPLS
jgi:phosphopantothenoylcysteine synthetase/decarboxylase